MSIDLSDYCTPDGTTDNSAAIATAINYAIDNNVELIVDAQSQPYVIAGNLAFTLVAGETLQINGSGNPKILIGGASNYALAFNAPSETLTLDADAAIGDESIAATDATNAAVGDIIRVVSNLVQETGWYYRDYDVRKITAKSSNVLSFVDGLEFEHKILCDQSWVATATGELTYWYPLASTPSSSIDVLVNDVVDATAVFEPSGGFANSLTPNSSKYGWLVTVDVQSGDSIKIRRKVASNFLVYKNCGLQISGITFDRLTGVGSPYIIIRGVDEPAISNVQLLTQGTPRKANGITFAFCMSPRVSNIKTVGLLYSLLFQEGTYDTRVSDVYTEDSHHAVAFSTFAKHGYVQRVSSNQPGTGMMDVHPSFDIWQTLGSEENTGLLNNRGEGGGMCGIDSPNSTSQEMSHRILWLDNQSSNSPKAARPIKDRPFIVTGCNVPGMELALACYVVAEVHGSTFRTINGQNSAGSAFPKSILIKDTQVSVFIRLRFAGAVTMDNVTVPYINLVGTQSNWSLVCDGCNFTDDDPIRNASGLLNETRVLTFRDCNFTASGNGVLFSNVVSLSNYPLDITIEDCTFTGFSSMGALGSASLTMTRPTYVNSSGLQQAVEAI